jgi:CheY-like chemotaxis protein
MPAKVVIIEDEVLLALDIERVLEDGGFTVIGIAADREEALELAAEAELALVDLNLRDGLTGPDTAAELAQRYGTRILYVTANPAQIRPRAETAAGVVVKPFSDRTLLEAALYSSGRLETKPSVPGFRAFDAEA